MRLLASALLILLSGGMAHAGVFVNPAYNSTLALGLGVNTVSYSTTGSCTESTVLGITKTTCEDANSLQFNISFGDGLTLDDIIIEVTSYTGPGTPRIRFDSAPSGDIFERIGVTYRDVFTGFDPAFGNVDGPRTLGVFRTNLTSIGGAGTYSYTAEWRFTLVETHPADDPVSDVPAPAPLGLIGFGLLGLSLAFRRRLKT